LAALISPAVGPRGGKFPNEWQGEEPMGNGEKASMDPEKILPIEFPPDDIIAFLDFSLARGHIPQNPAATNLRTIYPLDLHFWRADGLRLKCFKEHGDPIGKCCTKVNGKGPVPDRRWSIYQFFASGGSF
jgi:hypothetical protein